MLKRIEVNNYKTLVNFSLEVGPLQLWMGANGMGKTSVLEVLQCVQDILSGKYVETVFPSSTKTRWMTLPEQTFRIMLEIDGHEYEYRLSVIHENDRSCRINEEKLIWNNRVFYHYDGTQSRLFRIHRDTHEVELGTAFSHRAQRSLISSLDESEGNWPLIKFRENVCSWLIIQPISPMVDMFAETENSRLSHYTQNFADWYRYIIQEHAAVIVDSHEALKEALPGFESLNLKGAGEFRKLVVQFKHSTEPLTFSFNNLSDGQRQLIVLHTIAMAMKHNAFSTLFIDEPDNFVSIPEVLPFLGVLEDICEDAGKQAVIISHHPYIIDEMGHGEAVWFSREKNLHTTTSDAPPPHKDGHGIPPSEILARGWKDA